MDVWNVYMYYTFKYNVTNVPYYISAEILLNMHDNIIEMKIWNILISQIYIVRFPMKNILDVNNYI